MPKKREKDRKKVLTWRGKADIISFAAADAAVFPRKYSAVMQRTAEKNPRDFFTGALPAEEPGKQNKKISKKVLTKRYRSDILNKLSLRRQAKGP